MPGQEVTYCYYFHTPNAATVDQQVGLGARARQPSHDHVHERGCPPADGTVDENCGFGGSAANSLPVWTYATQTENQEEDLPADDGAGKPLAQNIAANSAGYLQMHYLNATQGSDRARDSTPTRCPRAPTTPRPTRTSPTTTTSNPAGPDQL